MPAKLFVKRLILFWLPLLYGLDTIFLLESMRLIMAVAITLLSNGTTIPAGNLSASLPSVVQAWFRDSTGSLLLAHIFAKPWLSFSTPNVVP